ncbi:MAG: T9SS type A sorting domain-containing protein [Rhodothermales bacterium]
MRTFLYNALLFTAAGLLAVSPALADSISGIRIAQPSPSYLTHNQNVEISFAYATGRAGGVRIFARPFTEGALTPGYTASGSPLYPTGSGAGNGTFTITGGDVTVDQIRFQMLNDDQTEIIMEFFVDVQIHFGEHGISNIALDPSGFASLVHGEDVSATFDYATSEVGGVRIFLRPMTGGDLSPAYSAHGSGIYPAGTGAGTGFFSITEGDVTVDQIRFRMTNADQTVVLLEFFLDVDYVFSDHAIRNIVVTPDAPAALPLGSATDRVEVSFDYATSEAGGVRIFARPFTEGGLTPGYGASGSPTYPVGTGSGSGTFTINTGAVHVDGIRFQMLTDDQTQVLLELVVPVDVLFADNRVANIDFAYASPGYFTLDEETPFTFDYAIAQAGGARIFGRPFTADGLTPGYGAHGSGLYTGEGAASGFFTISGAAADVDHVRFQILTADQSAVLTEYFVPVDYHFIAPYSNVASEDEGVLPGDFSLEQNYPNPFNPSTSIPFNLAQTGPVSLTVFDMLGREVRTLVDETLPAGRHEVSFDAGALPSGMYIYRLKTAAGSQTRTLALMK